MEYPGFFDEIEVIVLKDELTKLLGVNKDGVIEMSYLDIVKNGGAGYLCGFSLCIRYIHAGRVAPD